MNANIEALNTIVELANELADYNDYADEPLTLEKYLIQELNYPPEDAKEISRYYNIIMNYS